ncbi:YbjN domain-containing protein [Sandaracinobacteroides hominis]|uniref:YbjN domain-containing protein n=1 Tax=Sandaracinobacteroides hominis TaxID=2780086 RepID=UPI0018F63881|nr:YbjN domain-containing protein [Sandaracinobacteroides hominis]
MGKARLIAIAALLAAPVAAQVPPAPIADTRIIAANPRDIAELMREKGFLAELATDQSGDPQIRTGFGGTRGNVWFHECDEKGEDCRGIELQIGVIMDHKLSMDEVNAFNAEARFAFLTLDSEKDAILRYELSLAPPGVSAAVLTDTLQAFEEQARRLMQIVVKHDSVSRTERVPR